MCIHSAVPTNIPPLMSHYPTITRELGGNLLGTMAEIRWENQVPVFGVSVKVVCVCVYVCANACMRSCHFLLVSGRQ